MTVTIIDEKDKDDEDKVAELSPEFDPSITTYTLTVDEEIDRITIDVLPESEDAEISNPTVVTKYGEVPAIEGMNISLVGGTSRITFTVTDEIGIARTYTIYVEKPEDGDTTLESLVISPEVGFANGLALDKNLNKAFKGSDKSANAYYKMTLSADSRKDVSEVEFTATPTNKRTVVSYGVSDSITEMPVEWSVSFDKSNAKSQLLTEMRKHSQKFCGLRLSVMNIIILKMMFMKVKRELIQHITRFCFQRQEMQIRELQLLQLM